MLIVLHSPVIWAQRRHAALLMLISGESVGVEGSAAGGLGVNTTRGVEWPGWGARAVVSFRRWSWV